MPVRYQILAVVLAACAGCVPFFDAEPTGELVEFSVNACGGTDVLTFDGEDALPLQACGVCPGEGYLACNGVDALRCVGSQAPNACGGCLPLPAAPFDACGVCAGEPAGHYVCDGVDALECLNSAGYNACGGCIRLQGEPGQPCDPSDNTAAWTCESADAVTCTAGGPNLCGGDQDLAFSSITAPAPGMLCEGACDPRGVLRCGDTNALICEEAGQLNVCDGCGLVPGEFEAQCGRCGRYTCSDTQMFCVDPEPNQCGGCGELGRVVGERCEGGVVICNGDDEVICVSPSGESNACGGLGDLANTPGDPCGACNSGVWVCDGTSAVVCEGGRGDGAFNSCGGCASLPASEGDPCGECGSGAFVCDPRDTNRLICEGATRGEEAQNACGGCGFLWGTPGESCGECFTWQCSSTTEAVVCAWAGDEPGGCPDQVDCTECTNESRTCDEAGVCGDCVDGYEDQSGTCELITVECSQEDPCPRGDVRPVAGSICERRDESVCELNGTRQVETQERECSGGTCVDTGDWIPAGAVDCPPQVDTKPCQFAPGVEGVCDASICRPYVVITTSGESNAATVRSGACPTGYRLVSGGCRTDGGSPISASGPVEFLSGARGELARSDVWMCEPQDPALGTLQAFAVCARQNLIEQHSFISAVSGAGVRGTSPACRERGVVIGGGCDGGSALVSALPSAAMPGAGGLVDPDGTWLCETRNSATFSDSAASCLTTSHAVRYAASGSDGDDGTASCGEGLLIGGGCTLETAGLISGSYPNTLSDGMREWRCESQPFGEPAGVAVAICLSRATED